MEFVIKTNRGDSKWVIRHKVWNYIEVKNLASFPRPVHNRIPNFKGALEACGKVSLLEVFTKTAAVKVGPDKPLEGVRLAALQARKTLLVPTPRLRTGLFNRIIPPKGATKQELRVCSTSQGIKDFSVPIGLDDKVQVDLVVVGSVAVSDKGYRIGKGEGFADMEYALMACMGAVGESTMVVTIVHDCQVMDIPEELIESHDLTVNFILTPTRIIKTECKHPKPQGIIWSKLDTEVLKKIPILKTLRTLEQEAGKDVALKTTPAREDETKKSKELKWQPDCYPKPELQCECLTSEGDKCAAFECKFPESPVTTVYCSDIPAGLRVSELKSLLRKQEAVPLRIIWQGAKHRAFLLYANDTGAEHALTTLKKLSIYGHTLHAECVRSHTKLVGKGH
ncbi:methenyltetrahydrofolate synthase domain-containing protein isoform X1 [Ctenopharyngodon idella]|uniref:methenyltetrahydrofolate synthase domain-containing protein isoform X1 n=1 Tax=Ctenopharyngodon idella TaxID=7959 RepID=UPI00222FC5B9|nr:methenyltetrahydrofolate synthase domain-containing protein isoform X1 [Ctenopharyngodon idella]